MKTDWKIGDEVFGVASMRVNAIGTIKEIETVAGVQVANIKYVGNGNWVESTKLMDYNDANAKLENVLQNTVAGRIVLKQRETDKIVLEEMKDGLVRTKRTLSVKLKLHPPAVEGAIRRLVRLGKIVKTEGGGWVVAEDSKKTP